MTIIRQEQQASLATRQVEEPRDLFESLQPFPATPGPVVTPPSAYAATGDIHPADQELKSFLVKLRADARDPRRPERVGISQARTAASLGISPAWWRRLEAGRAPWTQQRAEEVVDLLGLTCEQREYLYQLSLGYGPFPRWRHPQHSVTKRLIRNFRHPALLLDTVGTYAEVNTAFKELFPECENHETVSDTLLIDTAARSRMLDWKGAWAQRIVRWMRDAYVSVPADKRARARRIIVNAQMSTSPELDDLWNDPHLGLPRAETVWCESASGAVELTPVIAKPMNDPDLTAVFWMRTADARPELGGR